ncbi:hypothetical protein J6590_015257 [Homalodisca vitripennis]|nr:hypothetical protein J6590_015257 [Homalodisca vitripennis]
MAVAVFHTTPSYTMCGYRDRMDTSSSWFLVWFYIVIADSNGAIPVGNGCGSISHNFIIHNVRLQRQDGYQLELVPVMDAIPVGNGCGSISHNFIIHNVRLQRQDGYQLELGMAVAAFHTTSSSTMCGYRDRMDTSSSWCLVWFYIVLADSNGCYSSREWLWQHFTQLHHTQCAVTETGWIPARAGAWFGFILALLTVMDAIPVGDGCGSISYNVNIPLIDQRTL